MVNENYAPGDREEAILAVLKEGRGEGVPWGRTNPAYLAERLDERRQYINRSLQSLCDAGWVRKLGKGLYEYVDDPRDDFEPGDQLRGDGAGAIGPTTDPADEVLEDVAVDEDPYADANQLAVELLERSDERLQASALQEAAADELPDGIKPASWWERHGQSAVEDAGADHHMGLGWTIDEQI